MVHSEIVSLFGCNIGCNIEGGSGVMEVLDI